MSDFDKAVWGDIPPCKPPLVKLVEKSMREGFEEDARNMKGRVTGTGSSHDVPVGICEKGKRDDGGKLRWHLIPVPAMVAFTKVWHAGAVKYTDENWRGGLRYSRIYRPMLSHLNKWLASKSSYDKELGTHHLMMVAWGCFVLYMYEIVFGYTHLDDRLDRGTLNDVDFEYVPTKREINDWEDT